jgi:hypothetical protein
MEIVKNKLILNGYVMIKNKVRDDRYYWECEKRCHKKRSRDTFDNFCNAKAITNVFNGVHNIYGTPLLHAPEHIEKQ